MRIKIRVISKDCAERDKVLSIIHRALLSASEVTTVELGIGDGFSRSHNGMLEPITVKIQTGRGS